MSAHSTNVVSTDTNEARFILRPIYYILRPDNKLVPLIAGDELPSWLKVVGSYLLDVTNIRTVNNGDPCPRKGEYDIICQYCVDATENMHKHGERSYDPRQGESGIDALRGRGYAPTGQNLYAHRVPAAPEAPVQQFVQPIYNTQPAQFPQLAQLGPSSQTPIQSAQLMPPLLPHILSLSPQLSGLNHQHFQEVQQTIQLQSLQQHPRPELHYQRQLQLDWWQDRDQSCYYLWDCKSPPLQSHCRLLPGEQQPVTASDPAFDTNVKQCKEMHGLNATAPAFMPSYAEAFGGWATLNNQ